MKTRVLFVNDERRVLDGLRRMLRPLRQEWEMAFAGGGDAGGSIVAAGTPETVADVASSYTGRFLKAREAGLAHIRRHGD